MDNSWERSIPFYHLDLVTASRLFRQFDPKTMLKSIHQLNEGKRNTNYRIHTSSGDYVLRMYPLGDESWRKESKIRSVWQDELPLQRLCYLDQHEAIGNRTFAIYEFVQGHTFLEALLAGDMPNEDVLHQLGGMLATIHEFRYPQVGFLNEHLEVVEELTPLETWYAYFLNSTVCQRLGKGMVDRIERLVTRNKIRLRDMDQQVSLVHGDFRPTNLLLLDGKITCILDWEFAMAGHSIADIGQLFRYESQFQATHKQAFVQGYNERSAWKLPADWENQGKIRDLVNLLQMLGTEEELPVKFLDVSQLIEGTLRKLEAAPSTDRTFK